MEEKWADRGEALNRRFVDQALSASSTRATERVDLPMCIQSIHITALALGGHWKPFGTKAPSDKHKEE
jgi:hypothetical protein